MIIKFKYTQASTIHEGEFRRTSDMIGHHEVVAAVVQKIANETGEIIPFSMLSLDGTVVIGTNYAEPQDFANTGLRTVQVVEISEDGGKTWFRIHVPS